VTSSSTHLSESGRRLEPPLAIADCSRRVLGGFRLFRAPTASPRSWYPSMNWHRFHRRGQRSLCAQPFPAQNEKTSHPPTSNKLARLPKDFASDLHSSTLVTPTPTPPQASLSFLQYWQLWLDWLIKKNQVFDREKILARYFQNSDLVLIEFRILGELRVCPNLKYRVFLVPWTYRDRWVCDIETNKKFQRTYVSESSI